MLYCSRDLLVYINFLETFAATGHFLGMMATNSRPGLSSRYGTKYMNTTGLCMELYFQTTSPSASLVSVVSLLVLSEDRSEKYLVSSTGNEPAMWNRLFTQLPDGIYQVFVEGRRSASGFSSLSVDDITIAPCDQFGEFFIRATAAQC